MKKYLVAPEGCVWTVVEANSVEMAYRSQCRWYSPDRKILIYDIENGVSVILKRKLDKYGNIECVVLVGNDEL